MKKNAFTLLELLIIITIIAILVGAVLPFVQHYVEEARLTKAKQDLTEIRNALMRFESDQETPYTESGLHRLIGSYLSKGMADPWGVTYLVSPASSTCYSNGPDRLAGTGDEIAFYFRPPLAISRVFWEDTNKSLVVDTGDKLKVKFTRPLRKLAGDGPVLAPIADDDFVYSNGAPGNPYQSIEYGEHDMMVKVALDFGPSSPFVVGVDTLSVKNACKIVDGDGKPCKNDSPVLIKPL